jgi:hypothetical protein
LKSTQDLIEAGLGLVVESTTVLQAVSASVNAARSTVNVAMTA